MTAPTVTPYGRFVLPEERLSSGTDSLDNSAIPMCRADGSHPDQPDTSVNVGAQQILIESTDSGGSRIVFQPNLTAGANHSQRSPNARELYLILRDGRSPFAKPLSAEALQGHLPNGAKLSRMTALVSRITELAEREKDLNKAEREGLKRHRAELKGLYEDIDLSSFETMKPALEGHPSQGFGVCRLPVKGSSSSSSSELQYNYYMSLFDTRFDNSCSDPIGRGSPLSREQGIDAHPPPGTTITPGEWVNLLEAVRGRGTTVRPRNYCFAGSGSDQSTLLAGGLRDLRSDPIYVKEMISYLTGIPVPEIKADTEIALRDSRASTGNFDDTRALAMAQSLRKFIDKPLSETKRQADVMALQKKGDERGDKQLSRMFWQFLATMGVQGVMLYFFHRMMKVQNAMMSQMNPQKKGILDQISTNLREHHKSNRDPNRYFEVRDESTRHILGELDSLYNRKFKRGAYNPLVIAPSGWGKQVVIDNMVMKFPDIVFRQTSKEHLLGIEGGEYRSVQERVIAHLPDEMDKRRHEGHRDVLVIDEFHNIGDRQQGQQEGAFGKLKGPFANGTIQGAGLTTFSEFLDLLERAHTDRSLRPMLNRFQPIYAPPRPVEEIVENILNQKIEQWRQEGVDLHIDRAALELIARASRETFETRTVRPTDMSYVRSSPYLVSERNVEVGGQRMVEVTLDYGHIPRHTESIFDAVTGPHVEAEGSVHISYNDVAQVLRERLPIRAQVLLEHYPEEAARAGISADNIGMGEDAVEPNQSLPPEDRDRDPRMSEPRSEARGGNGAGRAEGAPANASLSPRDMIERQTISRIAGEVAIKKENGHGISFSSEAIDHVWERVSAEKSITLQGQEEMARDLFNRSVDLAPDHVREIQRSHVGPALNAWSEVQAVRAERQQQISEFFTSPETDPAIRALWEARGEGSRGLLVSDLLDSWQTMETQRGACLSPKDVVRTHLVDQGLVQEADLSISEPLRSEPVAAPKAAPKGGRIVLTGWEELPERTIDHSVIESALRRRGAGGIYESADFDIRSIRNTGDLLTYLEEQGRADAVLDALQERHPGRPITEIGVDAVLAESFIQIAERHEGIDVPRRSVVFETIRRGLNGSGSSPADGRMESIGDRRARERRALEEARRRTERDASRHVR